MANKSFDPTRFRKDLTKAISGMSSGFNDPKDWISTGNFALNYLISGDFHKGVPLGKVTVFAGESGAGKSYICSGNIVKAAQDQGIFVVLIDSENALDESWLHALNVDTSEDKLLKLNMSMIDDVAKTLSTFIADYKTMEEEDRPKVLFVVDSLGMLLTPTDIDQFNKGDMKGDMGRKPKQFASSIVVAMKKMKLKEDEDGNKISQVMGIRAGCKVMKTRYAKPFEGVQVKIPYSTGMNPYSGLLELFEAKDIIKKQGNRLAYTTLDGEEILDYRKKWIGENLDKVMSDYLVKEATVVNTENLEDDDIDIVEDNLELTEE